MNTNLLEEIKLATTSGNAPKVAELCLQCVEGGIEVETIIEQALIAAMSMIGERFKKGEIYVPEMLIAARAMQAGLKVLEPLIVGKERRFLGKLVIGTVKGDLHDIGKNLVGMMAQGAGFEVVDVGTDQSVDKIIAAVREHKPQLLGLSALLTTTMPVMREIIIELEREGLRDQVKVLVGGAPVTEKFAQDIGADAFAADAGSAVDMMRSLC